MSKRSATAQRGRTAVRNPPPGRGRPVADVLDRRLERSQLVVLCAVVLLTATVLRDGWLDPFMLPKITVIVLSAVLLLGLAGLRTVRAGRWSLPRGAVGSSAAAFAAALVVATLAADNRALAFVGNHSRYGGSLSYLSYLVVLLVAARVVTATSSRPLLLSMLGALAVVTTYGLMQVAGLDPYDWSVRLDEPVFSTMGNTNFAGAYVAVLLPVAAALVLLPGHRPGWRVAAGVLGAAGAVYVVATGAAQGVLAALAGVAVVVVAVLLGRRRTPSARAGATPPWVRPAIAGGVLAALAVVAVLGARLARDISDSYAERLQFWRAALSIAADHPVLGTGLDSFRDQFVTYRPAAHAVEREYQITDSAHNAVLGMLANGGLLLAASYLALVLVAAWALLRGLRTADPASLLPVAAFGGVWAAFQVQSMVSVDVPPLVLLNFLATGALVGLSGLGRPAGGVLPWPAARPGSLLPRTGAPRRVVPALLVVLLAVTTGAALWASLRPVRAELAAVQARQLTALQAVRSLDRAVELAPWEAEYRIVLAQARLKAGDRAGALQGSVDSAVLRRGSSKLAVGVVDLADRQGREDLAAEWMRRALERDPNNPVVLERGAEYYRETGNDAQANQLAARAERLEQRYGSA